jgi:hypothetical protein
MDTFDIPLRAKLALYLDPETVNLLDELSKNDSEQMSELRGYNLYWKERLEILLIKEGYSISNEGLPFTSANWREVYQDVIRCLDDPDLMFSGTYILAQIGLYIKALTDQQNKPRVLVLCIESGYDDIAMSIMDTYEGEVKGFCLYQPIGADEADYYFYNPFDVAIMFSSVELLDKIVKSLEEDYETIIKKVYTCISLNMEDKALVLLQGRQLNEEEDKVVALLEAIKGGKYNEDNPFLRDLTFDKNLLFMSALASGQLYIADQILRSTLIEGSEGQTTKLQIDSLFLQKLAIDAPIESVQLVLTYISSYSWLVMADFVVERGRLDVLEILLESDYATPVARGKLIRAAERKHNTKAIEMLKS